MHRSLRKYTRTFPRLPPMLMDEIDDTLVRNRVNSLYITCLVGVFFSSRLVQNKSQVYLKVLDILTISDNN